MAREVDRPVFVLRVRAVPQADPIRSLRAILKVLGWHGLRCLGVVEEANGEAPMLEDTSEDDVANVASHARKSGGDQ